MSRRADASAAQPNPGRLARTLWLGASAATLGALAVGAPARADTTVNGGSTAVATATIASGAPDNIIQSGTLAVSSGAAVTLNSSNSVTNSGTIGVQNTSGLTGVLALGGNAGSITNTGQITYNQSSALTATDSNGVITGPFATDSNLFGVRVTGPGTLTGSIFNSGGLTIQGDGSSAISVEAPLTGAISDSGAISVAGAGVAGVRTTSTVGGAVTVAGALTATGPGAQAINLGGEAGALQIESAVSSTGYHTPSRGATTSVLTDQNANDIAQDGATVVVGGGLDKGLLISAPPVTLSSANPDVNGDGVTDSVETTGTVTSYGSAPAILIGGTATPVRLGAVGTGASAYSVVIEGSASGQGLRDGVSANGLQIGAPNGAAVTLASGISVTGSLTATAYGGDATALHVMSGGASNVLYNAGQLTALMAGETTNAAHAVVVDAGGSLPTILNAGNIAATVVGSSGSATAILDNAGSLTHLENTGTIAATAMAATGSTAPVSGTTIAIDDSKNATGLSLVSYKGADSTTAPSITGSVLMGAGDDSVGILAGAMAGDLAFGAGANALTVDGGATVTGAVTATGGTLALSVNKGVLQIDNAATLAVTDLNLGPSSKLVLTADPAANAATRLNVSGTADIAQGAKLGLRVVSLVGGTSTYTLVSAPQINGAVDAADLLASAPYLYDASVRSDATSIAVTLSRKTAAQLGLDPSLAGGLDPVLAAASGNPGLSQGLLAPTDKAGFNAAYNQLLPEHSGGVFQLVQAGVEAFGRPLDDRQTPEGDGAWIEEVNVGALAGNRDSVPGYKGWGVGLIGGFELPATRLGVFGATVGGFSGEIRPRDTDPDADTIANLVEAGGYWRATLGRFALNARAAADYLMATNHRVVSFSSGGESLFSGTAVGHWSGWGLTSRFRASYEQRWSSLYLRPQLGIDFLRLSEGAYAEGGNSALDLAVNSRTTSEFSGFAGLAIGATFGEDGASWGPEVLLGYRDVISKDDGLTTARFVSGGDSFSIGPNPVSGSGGVARLALKSESGWGAVSLEGGAEVRDGLTLYDVKLAVHLLF